MYVRLSTLLYLGIFSILTIDLLVGGTFCSTQVCVKQDDPHQCIAHTALRLMMYMIVQSRAPLCLCCMFSAAHVAEFLQYGSSVRPCAEAEASQQRQLSYPLSWLPRPLARVKFGETVYLLKTLLMTHPALSGLRGSHSIKFCTARRYHGGIRAGLQQHYNKIDFAICCSTV